MAALPGLYQFLSPVRPEGSRFLTDVHLTSAGTGLWARNQHEAVSSPGCCLHPPPAQLGIS
jgi:hypothetical protein